LADPDRRGDRFGSGFVELTPNSKIPALLDISVEPVQRVFESGAILLYLAEKFWAFLPEGLGERAECLSRLFWQMGSAPYLGGGGGFGRFYAYASCKMRYPVDRFAMEVKRQLDVLDKRLAEHPHVAGTYSIADMAIWPWYGNLVAGKQYGAGELLSVQEYMHVRRWHDAIMSREAVSRGRRVNRIAGPKEDRSPERHDPSDLDRPRGLGGVVERNRGGIAFSAAGRRG